MKQKLLQQVGRSARLTVMNELKRTQGLGVGDLATRLGMSYMGVKGICLDLEKRGLVDTWRQAPQKSGRPQLLYRLTERAHELFPTASNPLTIELLQGALRLYGATAPEKLLMVVFQQAAEKFAPRVQDPELAVRVERLARIRDQEGYMARCEPGPTAGSFVITEHHSPILDVMRAFPIVVRLEAELFERLLGAPVQRGEQSVSGLYQANFRIG